MRARILSIFFLFISLLLLIPCTMFAVVPSQGDIESGNAERILRVSDLAADTLSETGRAWVGLYADANKSSWCLNNPGGFFFFNLWVCWNPNAAGMMGAEFKINYPASVVGYTVTTNPIISMQSGSLDTGIIVEFSECQTDHIWTQNQFCFTYDTTPMEIELVAHPASGDYRIRTCEAGRPYAPVIRFEPFRINSPYGCCGCIVDAPRIWKVIPKSLTSLDALFSYEPFEGCLGGLNASHLVLYSKTVTPDTIAVKQVTKVLPNLYELSLASEMQDGTVYVLGAHTLVCGGCMCWFVADSRREFLYSAAVATLLQSCAVSFAGTGVQMVWELAEVRAWTEFFVSRSENGTDFVALDMAALTRDGLRFAYADLGVEPGKSYVYKVEYTINGTSRLLFISEEIRTPAALLALHQNRPNPFNPSTTISFTLPGQCAVRLEVYDVSGRLVARLIDGARQSAGPHDVEWNGRDASGRAAASGIYVYRLTAGKETISRKMVLLR